MSNDLVYNGVLIRDRDEMLSLTDMWRAAGSDPNKRPAKWREQDGVKEFLAHILTILPEDSEIFQVLNENGEWNTWAHWQPALAYAKYLSPEMHARANQIWRAHIEGNLQPALSEEQIIRQALFLVHSRLEEANKKIEEIEPDANAFQRIKQSDGSFCVTYTAKMLKVNPKPCFRVLQAIKWIYRKPGNTEFVAFQNHIDNGDLEQIPLEVQTKWGPKIVERVLVTAQGFAKLLKHPQIQALQK